MSRSKPTSSEAILARISLGAVPMGGVYWVDPKAVREEAESAKTGAGAESTAGGSARISGSIESGQTPRGVPAKWSLFRRTGGLS